MVSDAELQRAIKQLTWATRTLQELAPNGWENKGAPEKSKYHPESKSMIRSFGAHQPILWISIKGGSTVDNEAATEAIALVLNRANSVLRYLYDYHAMIRKTEDIHAHDEALPERP